MDWNWFFSAVAQSAAAIVGILAAFIITKIISNQADFKRKSVELLTIQADSEKLAAQLHGRPIDWYNGYTREDQLTMVYELIRKHNSKDPLFYFRELDFSPYDNHGEILKAISEAIEQRFDPDPERALNHHILPAAVKEREEIDERVLEIKDHAKRVRLFLAQVKDNPESSGLVNALLLSLLFLFYMGVIYPLSFLPVDGDAKIILTLSAFFDILFSLKGAILAGVSIVFNGILLLFIRINWSLKYDAIQINTLRKFTTPNNYSEYIQNRYDNLEALKLKPKVQNGT